jgi:ATP-binding cassette subfamily F protein uup
VYALTGDGTLRMLPRGIDEYLERRTQQRESARPGIDSRTGAPGSAKRAPAPAASSAAAPSSTASSSSAASGAPGTQSARKPAAVARAGQKEMQRIERRLDRIGEKQSELHEAMAEHATDFERVAGLDAELRRLDGEREDLETRWLELAEGA